MSILIKNGYVLTFDQENEVIKNGAVYIEDDIIREIGYTEDLLSRYSGAEHVLDANGRVVMPGLICGHMHFYSAFATGMPLAPFPKGFVNVLKNLWWKVDRALTKEDIYYSALLGYIQAIRSGTTTVIDHHASPSFITGSLDEIAQAAQEMGVRSTLCYETTNRNGDEGAIEGLKENERFLQKVQSAKNELLSGLVGLHASFTVTEETLDKTKELIDKYDSGIHIHVAEGKADMEDAQKQYNSTVIERLDNHGLLNKKAILAHCIHITDEDYPILKRTGANIVHQPRSNMNNAVGTLNIWKLKEHDIAFGIGTDGMSADMRAEIMVGALIHKHVTQNNLVGTTEICDALFKTNPVIYKKLTGQKIGVLAEEYKADVLITNYYPKTPIRPDNVIGHIMFGLIHQPIATTIINGIIRMEEGKVLDINEAEITQKTQQLAPGVWERVAKLEKD